MAGNARRIIVIGSGIIGSSIAYHLAMAGAVPHVIEAGEAGGLATPASWAWINASWGNSEPYFRLRMRSIREWHRLQKELPDLAVSWAGSLTYDLQPDQFETYCRQHGAWGYRIRLVGREEIATREPALHQVPEVAALCEDEGVVEPVAAAAILLRAAQRRGAELSTQTAVLGLTTKGGRVTGVRTAGGTMQADGIVVAAGKAAPGLLAKVGYTLPLEAPQGLLVHSHPVPRLLHGLLIAPELHLRQTRAGRLVAGFDFVGSVLDSEAKSTARLIGLMTAALKVETPLTLSHTTLGLRPTPSDGLPVVGAIPGVEGLYTAVMHSGITLAAIVGLSAATEILSDAREDLLMPYRPERFQAP